MGTVAITFEWACFVVMGAWLLGSIAYALPLAALRRRLERRNLGLWFANWTVFGTGKERAEIARYTLRYRDVASGVTGDWVSVMSGRRWCWHAFLWQPERRLADRLQRIGQEIARALEHPEGERRIIAPRRELIARHLEARFPRAPQVVREVQFLEHRSVVESTTSAPARNPGVEERAILAFQLPSS